MLLIPFHLILYCCIFNVFAFLQNAFYEKEMITLSVQNYVDPARSNFLLYLSIIYLLFILLYYLYSLLIESLKPKTIF